MYAMPCFSYANGSFLFKIRKLIYRVGCRELRTKHMPAAWPTDGYKRLGWLTSMLTIKWTIKSLRLRSPISDTDIRFFPAQSRKCESSLNISVPCRIINDKQTIDRSMGQHFKATHCANGIQFSGRSESPGETAFFTILFKLRKKVSSKTSKSVVMWPDELDYSHLLFMSNKVPAVQRNEKDLKITVLDT